MLQDLERQMLEASGELRFEDAAAFRNKMSALSRVLHQLSDAGLLAVNGRDITLLDLDKVRAFGCG